MNTKFAKILSTESIIVCGLRAKMVTYNKNYYPYSSPNVFYLEDSLKDLYNRTGIDCFEKLKGYKGSQDSSRRVLDCFDGAIVPLSEDIEWYNYISKEFEKLPEFVETLESEHFSNICNWIGNMAINDVPFAENGKYGVMDCQGNVLLPALFDECEPTLEPAFLVPVKNGGKWGFAFRDGSNVNNISFLYDEVESWANFFVTHIDNKVGIIGPSGKIIIPIEMDDLTFVSLAGVIIFKKNNKYGFRFNNRKYIEPIVDEILVPERKKRQKEYESVRFRIGNEWKFLTHDGLWINSPAEDILKEYDLNLESLIKPHKNII